MAKKSLKITVIFITFLMLTSFIPRYSYALQEDTITGFENIEENLVYFNDQQEKNEIVNKLPKQINVYVNNSKEATPINVKWQCLEDYDHTNFFIYSFRPIWDKQKYILDKKINELMAIPWIFAKKTKNTSNNNLNSICSFCQTESESNETNAYNYLTKTLKLNNAAACGVLANLNAESGIIPNNLENYWESRLGYTDFSYTEAVDKGEYKNFAKDYAGYGICQWTSNGRKANLFKKKKAMNVSIANLKMQLAFLNDELKNYDSVMATLRGVPNTATGAFLAATVFCYSFERPAYTEQTSLSRGRIAVAGYWSKYSKDLYNPAISSLGICGYSYPDYIKEGCGVTVDGNVVSNYKISNVNVEICYKETNAVCYNAISHPYTNIYPMCRKTPYFSYGDIRHFY